MKTRLVSMLQTPRGKMSNGVDSSRTRNCAHRRRNGCGARNPVKHESRDAATSPDFRRQVPEVFGPPETTIGDLTNYADCPHAAPCAPPVRRPVLLVACTGLMPPQTTGPVNWWPWNSCTPCTAPETGLRMPGRPRAAPCRPPVACLTANSAMRRQAGGTIKQHVHVPVVLGKAVDAPERHLVDGVGGVADPFCLAACPAGHDRVPDAPDAVLMCLDCGSRHVRSPRSAMLPVDSSIAPVGNRPLNIPVPSSLPSDTWMRISPGPGGGGGGPPGRLAPARSHAGTFRRGHEDLGHPRCGLWRPSADAWDMSLPGAPQLSVILSVMFRTSFGKYT